LFICDDIIQNCVLTFLDINDLINSCRKVNKQFREAADILLGTHRYREEKETIVTH